MPAASITWNGARATARRRWRTSRGDRVGVDVLGDQTVGQQLAGSAARCRRAGPAAGSGRRSASAPPGPSRGPAAGGQQEPVRFRSRRATPDRRPPARRSRSARTSARPGTRAARRTAIVLTGLNAPRKSSRCDSRAGRRSRPPPTEPRRSRRMSRAALSGPARFPCPRSAMSSRSRSVTTRWKCSGPSNSTPANGRAIRSRSIRWRRRCRTRRAACPPAPGRARQPGAARRTGPPSPDLAAPHQGSVVRVLDFPLQQGQHVAVEVQLRRAVRGLRPLPGGGQRRRRGESGLVAVGRRLLVAAAASIGRPLRSGDDPRFLCRWAIARHAVVIGGEHAATAGGQRGHHVEEGQAQADDTDLAAGGDRVQRHLRRRVAHHVAQAGVGLGSARGTLVDRVRTLPGCPVVRITLSTPVRTVHCRQ